MNIKSFSIVSIYALLCNFAFAGNIELTEHINTNILQNGTNSWGQKGIGKEASFNVIKDINYLYYVERNCNDDTILKNSEFYKNTWNNIFGNAKQDSLANMIAQIYIKSDNGKNLKQSQINTLYYMYGLLKLNFDEFDKHFNTQKDKAKTVNGRYIKTWKIEELGKNVDDAISDYNKTYELSIDDKLVFTKDENTLIEKRKQEEEKKRIEEEKRKIEEEQKRLEEEKRKIEEEQKRLEEEKRKQEEELKRKQKELEEEKRKIEEERLKLQLEQLKKENEELKEKQRLYEEEQKRLAQEFEEQKKRENISKRIEDGKHSLVLMDDSITKQIFGTTDYTTLVERAIGNWFNYEKEKLTINSIDGNITIERYPTLYSISDYANILYMLSFKDGISSVTNFINPLINLMEDNKNEFDTPKKKKIISRIPSSKITLSYSGNIQNPNDDSHKELSLISMNNSIGETVKSIVCGSDELSIKGTIMQQQKGKGGKLTFKQTTTTPRKLAFSSICTEYITHINNLTNLTANWKGHAFSFDAVFLLYLDCVVNEKDPFQHITEERLQLISRELSKAQVNINGLFQNALQGGLKLIKGE